MMTLVTVLTSCLVCATIKISSFSTSSISSLSSMTIHAFLLTSGLTTSHLCSVRAVESIGENVDEVMEGDIVIPSFLADCGDCIDCKSKKSNLCSKFPFEVSPWMHRDKTSRFMDLKGETLYHFLYVSSFSEYTVVDVAHVTKIDPAIPPNRACLLSCGVSTGVGAAWRTADVEAGSTVAIFGLGAIGLAVAEGARMCGATRIIGVDVNPDKFETGKTFGVTDFVNSATCTDKRLSEVHLLTLALMLRTYQLLR
ncbi:alcohol dehydrogenase-like 7 [Camellia sinensis]|uniref:alcohol dehydrogenase-like 7 n=1 Tax=Camellia sinensis TaxID=4442 RepID=UPI001036703E|nr:alcohol dehydrogenase-like 7 [Camellia sinensis]